MSRFPRFATPAGRVLATALLVAGLAGPGRTAPTAADGTSAPRHVRARLLGVLDRRERAQLHYLEHLGWQFLPAAGTGDVRVEAGTPGWRRDLADARASGDLRILLPVEVTDAALRAFAANLDRIAEGTASRLAYNLRLADATARATAKIQANVDRGNYAFPQIVLWNSPWWRLAPPEPEWIERDKVWFPRCSPSRAVAAFYTREAEAECYGGQLVAVFASQYELYGPEHFDRAFLPEEIALGKPTPAGETAFGWCLENDYGLFFPKEAWEQRDISLMLAELGPKAFVGVTGIIQDPTEQKMCNENLLIVDISAAAVRDMVQEGGFRIVGYQTMNALDHQVRKKYPFAVADEIEARKKAIDAILSRPFFTDTKVYIHPYGVVSMAKMVRKKLDDHTASVWLRGYWTGREHAFYRRYHEYFLRTWLAAHPETPALLGRP